MNPNESISKSFAYHSHRCNATLIKFFNSLQNLQKISRKRYLIFSNFSIFLSLYIIFNNVSLHETFQNFPFPMEIYRGSNSYDKTIQLIYENFPSLSSISNNTARFSSNSSHRTRVPDVLELWATIPSHWFIGRIIRSIREPIGLTRVHPTRCQNVVYKVSY